VSREEARRLEAQLAYLRSDDRMDELVALAAEMTPEERLAQAWEMCASAAAMLDQLPEDELRCIEETRDVPPPDAAPVLRRLARTASPDPDQ
jgi:hypothetical protein